MSAPAAGAAAGGSGLLATTASVVRNRPAMEAAFCSAERVTLTGSVTPAASRSSYSLVAAFRPYRQGRERTLSITTSPDSPAFSAICFDRGFDGAEHDRGTGCLVAFELTSLSALAAARTRATPPPGSRPSSMAALALRTASSMRCLRSLASTSVAAPTLMTATPPASLARTLLQLLTIVV